MVTTFAPAVGLSIFEQRVAFGLGVVLLLVAGGNAIWERLPPRGARKSLDAGGLTGYLTAVRQVGEDIPTLSFATDGQMRRVITTEEGKRLWKLVLLKPRRRAITRRQLPVTVRKGWRRRRVLRFKAFGDGTILLDEYRAGVPVEAEMYYEDGGVPAADPLAAVNDAYRAVVADLTGFLRNRSNALDDEASETQREAIRAECAGSPDPPDRRIGREVNGSAGYQRETMRIYREDWWPRLRPSVDSLQALGLDPDDAASLTSLGTDVGDLWTALGRMSAAIARLEGNS